MGALNEQLINKIKDYFDLNIYETKVWLALLTKGISSAGEIAELSGVPRSRTYDVLEGLEKRGFAIEKIGKPVKYLAVKPENVIEKLKNNAKKYAEEKVNILSKLKDTTEYEELQALHNTGLDPIKNSDMSTAIKGRNNLYTQMRMTMESSTNSVYLATSSFELTSKQSMFKEVFDKLKKRKIDVKVIISDNEDEAVKLTKRFGTEIRAKKINARFVIVDRKELVFTMKANHVHEDFDHGVWINSEFFTNSLAYMFELAWGKE